MNIIFTFSGIISNTLVMVCFWKSSQLQKKLSHFMIMVLSCFDLVAVVTNNLGLLNIHLISLLTQHYDLTPIWKMYHDFVRTFVGLSFLILLVMSIERYPGAYYPIFHRTSVTRRGLLTVAAMLFTFNIGLNVISRNDMIIPKALSVLISIIVVFPPLLFLNFKLFKMSREVRWRNAISLEIRTTTNLKNISTCLLVVACLVVVSISSSVYIDFNINTENRRPSNARLSRMWGATIFTMNWTFNSLILFWKNKIIRTEAIKTLKTLKDRLVGS